MVGFEDRTQEASPVCSTLNALDGNSGIDLAIAAKSFINTSRSKPKREIRSSLLTVQLLLVSLTEFLSTGPAKANTPFSGFLLGEAIVKKCSKASPNAQKCSEGELQTCLRLGRPFLSVLAIAKRIFVPPISPTIMGLTTFSPFVIKTYNYNYTR